LDIVKLVIAQRAVSDDPAVDDVSVELSRILRILAVERAVLNQGMIGQGQVNCGVTTVHYLAVRNGHITHPPIGRRQIKPPNIASLSNDPRAVYLYIAKCDVGDGKLVDLYTV
jgi:hypothetical protein